MGRLNFKRVSRISEGGKSRRSPLGFYVARKTGPATAGIKKPARVSASDGRAIREYLRKADIYIRQLPYQRLTRNFVHYFKFVPEKHYLPLAALQVILKDWTANHEKKDFKIFKRNLGILFSFAQEDVW